MYLTNKYTKWYYAIVDRARFRTIIGYTEKHHIIPKSLGGDNSKLNLVNLTAREHFICHRLLTKMTTGDSKRKMLHAVWAFNRKSKSQLRSTISSRTYESIRTELAFMLSATRKGIMNKGRTQSEQEKLLKSIASKGIPKSEETKHRMKEAWKNRPPRSKEHCDALSNALLGKRLSAETKKKMSDSKKGITPVHTMIPFICEYCGKQGVGIGNYKRWHGNNCLKRKL
jgi:hypothetical protein